MTPNDRFDERLQAYLDGELQPAERIALEAELKHDAALAEQLATLRRVNQMTRESGLPDPPEALLSAIRQRIESAGEPRWRRLFPAPGRPLPALAWGTATTALLAYCLVPMGLPAREIALTSSAELVKSTDAIAAESAPPPPAGPASTSLYAGGGGAVPEEAAIAPAAAAPASPAIVAVEAEGLAEADAAAAPPSRAMGGESRFGRERSEAARTEYFAQPSQVGGSPLEAGEVDDNEAFGKYLAYLRDEAPKDVSGLAYLPAERRRVIQVTAGGGVLDAPVELSDSQGQVLARLRTDSSGQAVWIPDEAVPHGAEITVRVPLGNVERRFRLDEDDPAWSIDLPVDLERAASVPLDLAFVIDTTGSMAEEIDRIRDTVRDVAARIARLPARPRLRLGLVLYRDQGDEYVTKVKSFTGSVPTFEGYLQYVTANGGGDTPEDVNAALDAAVTKLDWEPDGAVRLAFLIGDAPPQLEYRNSVSYARSAAAAARRGIKFYAIASSDHEDIGEYVWRQLALLTRGRFLFITKGGAAGITPHHVERQDYSVQALDDLVTAAVERELAALGKQPPRVTPVDVPEPREPVAVPPVPPVPPAPPVVVPPSRPRLQLPLSVSVLVLVANAAGWFLAWRRSRRPLRPLPPRETPRWQPPPGPAGD